MIFFEELIAFRLLSDRRKLVRKYVNNNKDVFDNESHFYRCAVESFLRECAAKKLSVGKGRIAGVRR